MAACIASPATRSTLERDLEAAAPFESDGTPIVAVNGRRGTSYGPFLYAMILTQGEGENPAFDVLPAGNPALSPEPEAAAAIAVSDVAARESVNVRARLASNRGGTLLTAGVDKVFSEMASAPKRGLSVLRASRRAIATAERDSG